MTAPADQQDMDEFADGGAATRGTRVAGMNASSALARRILRREPIGLQELRGVPVMALITTDEVTLTFTGPRSVPKLGIRGRMDALVATEPQEMPYFIEQITLDPAESVEVDITYTFTTEQLQELVGKGLYLEGFDPPREWVGIPMEFPSEIDLYVAPPLEEGDPPLVVTDLRAARFIDTSLSHSGYKFEDAFPDYRGELLAAGVLTEFDTPDTEVSLTEVSGFDFGTEQAVLPVVVQPSGLDFDAEAIMAELRELGGHDFEAPDQLRVLRADEQARIAAGTGELARAGLGSRDDERINREFHTSLARSRSELAGTPPGAVTGRTDDLTSDTDDADLLAAFADDADLDLGQSPDQEDSTFSGFDFGSLDDLDDLGAQDPEQDEAASSSPYSQDTPAGVTGMTERQPTVAELLGSAGAGVGAEQAEDELTAADAELLEMDENDAALREEATDTEQEKARKAALRARRAAAQRARRARERAARQAAAQNEMDLSQGLVSEKPAALPGLDEADKQAQERKAPSADDRDLG